MARRTLLVLALFLAPSWCWAQSSERSLTAGSQVYLRWDGLDAHRAAFDKTAFGKMIQGETGTFFSALWDWGNHLLETAVREKDPKAEVLLKEFKAFPTILGEIGRNGFALGIEVASLNPPQIQGTFVFPRSGGDKGSILPMLDKLAKLAEAPVKETKVGGRTVRSVDLQAVHFGWWNEPDDDAVVVLGTGNPVALAKAIDSRKVTFAQSATFKKLSGFKDFQPWARGHLDIAGLLGKVGELSPEADKLIGELGLKGLEGVSFYSGFDGAAERSIVDVHLTGKRKGLLALINSKTISLKDLPPMPDDITGFSASNFNLKDLYDAGAIIADAALNVFAPNQGADVKEAIKQFEGLLGGIRIGEDLFGSFDDRLLSYSSASEGFLGLGGVYLLKVKDEKKLAGTLEALIKAIPPLPGAEVALHKKRYHGAEIMTQQVKTDQGDFPLGSMTVHKGWFMFAGLPQPVQGYILRSQGELPAWKADEKLAKALAQFPEEFVAISVSDPRPVLQFLLAAAPTAMTFANTYITQALPGARPFDVSLIPHAQQAVRHLFPNVTVTTDDGKKIRTQTRASLALPF